MAKFQSPLLGYNNNVRHKNRVFHIQTEDSGVNHPHIITHLFMDGGRILKSVKRSYAEHVGADGMSELVRQMMKEQHKAMFIALRDGQFDHLVDPQAAPKPTPAAPEAPAAAAAAATTAAASDAPSVPPRAPSAAPPAAPPGPPPVETASAKIAAAAPAAVAVASSPPAEESPLTVRESAPPVPARELTLDLDALEQASAQPSSLFQASDLPPPPKNLFAKESTTGAYRTIEDPRPAARVDPREEPSDDRPRRASVPPASSRAPQSGRGAPASRPSGEGRYAPARPAAIFGSSSSVKPTPPAIFTDELVSDKSLDEVILSYLAEDLEPPHRK